MQFYYVMPIEAVWEVRTPGQVHSERFETEALATEAALHAARGKAAAAIAVGLRVQSAERKWRQFEVTIEGHLVPQPMSL